MPDMAHSFGGSNPCLGEPIAFRPLVGVQDSNIWEHIVQQTAHCMTRKQERKRKGPIVLLKGLPLHLKNSHKPLF